MAAETVLDHVENLVVAGTPFKRPANEYWALLCQQRGLSAIKGFAEACDQIAKKAIPNNAAKFFGMGNLPGTEGVDRQLLSCCFEWYAISACQYVRLIGAIVFGAAANPGQEVDKYTNRVIPNVRAFRDKVAAHYAWATKNSRDNDAEREASVMPTITVIDGKFHAAGMTLHLTRGGRSSSSASLKPWSICDVHRSLARRYWPEADQTGNS